MHQDYDHVSKENLTDVLPELLRHFLGFEFKTFQPTRIEYPKTLEKRSDIVYKIDENRLLQIEFQSGNDKKMLERMYLYSALIFFQTNKIATQVVIYYGEEKLNIKYQVDEENVKYTYKILDFTQIPYREFWQFNSDEVLIFSVLAEYPKEDAPKVIMEIIDELLAFNLSESALKVRLIQLEILSKLRNLQETVKKLKNMKLEEIKFRDLPSVRQEIDEALEEALEERNTEIVLNLYKLGVEISKISQATELSVEKIEEFISKAEQPKSSKKLRKPRKNKDS